MYVERQDEIGMWNLYNVLIVSFMNNPYKKKKNSSLNIYAFKIIRLMKLMAWNWLRGYYYIPNISLIEFHYNIMFSTLPQTYSAVKKRRYRSWNLTLLE